MQRHLAGEGQGGQDHQPFYFPEGNNGSVIDKTTTACVEANEWLKNNEELTEEDELEMLRLCVDGRWNKEEILLGITFT